MNDTIFALATAQGKAGIAVVRISGPGAMDVVSKLVDAPLQPRGMALRVLRDGSGARLDQGLVLTFSGPRSFTGEDVVELQLHGSVAVVSAVMRAVADCGARLAEPGEFTRRALENGQLDLTQVEGLADLIDAETESQRQQAERVLSGAVGQTADRWRVRLVRAAALIEATIDFADEDVPEDVSPEVLELVSEIRKEISDQLEGFSAAECVRLGFEVAIVGAPNVGKSTLLNRLAGREAAITSAVAGTTRDVIEVRMDIDGLAVTVLDTAGIRETADEVEQIGVARARERAEAADLRVFLSEAGGGRSELWRDGDIERVAKADLHDAVEGISGLTGIGVDELLDAIRVRLTEKSAGAGIVVRERHRNALSTAFLRLERVQELLLLGVEQYDIVAEELRSSIAALEALVGRVGAEDLLDEIFASFCLGK